MAMRNSVSVRFPKDISDQLDEVSRQSGLTAADLVRIATNEYLQNVRKTGSINIPVNVVAEPHAPYGSKKTGKQ